MPVAGILEVGPNHSYLRTSGYLPGPNDIYVSSAQVMEKGLKSIEECVEIARESIDSGKALATFKKFVEINS